VNRALVLPETSATGPTRKSYSPILIVYSLTFRLQHQVCSCNSNWYCIQS